jgi:tRNA (mo5U34)-methyltransferase
LALSDPELAARIAAFPRWHYRFDLRGHETPLADDKANRHEQRRRYFFDPLVELAGGSLGGKRVLDLGCNAGFWTLAALRAGADFVLAVDGRAMHVHQAALVLEVEEIDSSRYELVVDDVFEVDYARHGRFDIVLCLGLLYHVADPVGLLRRAAAANDDILVIDTALAALPGAAFRLDREPTDDPRNALSHEHVLVPTHEAVVELAEGLGYAVSVLEPAFTSYDGAEDYRDGHRRAFLCRRRG